jgi:hypothetical protein
MVNDATVTPTLAEQLREAGRDVAPAIGALTQWAAMRGDKARHHVSKPWHELRAADPFWD